MEVAYLYTKARKDFGKYPYFTSVPATIIESIPTSDNFNENYITRNPCVSCFDTAAQM